MQISARDFIEKEDGGAEKGLRTQTVPYWQTVLLFTNTEDKDYGLMSIDNFKKFKATLDAFESMSDWPNFCKAASVEDNKCAGDAILSPLLMFQAVGMNVSDEAIDKMTQQDLSFYFDIALTTPAIWDNFATFFDKAVNKDQQVVRNIRVFIGIGAPLEINGVRYSDKEDRNQEQERHVINFCEDVDVLINKKHLSVGESNTGFKADVFNFSYLNDKFQVLAEEDTSYAAFSVLFVFCYLIYHLKSLFLATIGISIILLSFPFTVIMTEGIF